jgi:hypothetical protein
MYINICIYSIYIFMNIYIFIHIYIYIYIVGSASKGVAQGFGVVSGDKEFVRQRDEKRRINTASSGGLLSGMKAGSESVFSGFASGITGLAIRPFEEGRRGGALGFVKVC